MKKDSLFTKYKFSIREIKIIEKMFKLSFFDIEPYIDSLSQVEQEKIFYKIRAKILESASKTV